jgi:hypothetical protein
MTLKFSQLSLYERTIHTLFGTLCVLALIYCALLLSLVFSVIERKQNNLAIRELRSELSSEETKYANTLSSITETKLTDAHYVKVDNSTFAVRKSSIATYTVLYGH